MRMNKKGFSMIELLGVIVILGILSTVAIGAASRYKDKAKKQGYDTLVASAKEAAEAYAMAHPTAKSVNFDTLVEEGYLENATDPGDSDNTCVGTVRITDGGKSVSSKIKKNDYTVYICCTNYQYEIGSDKPVKTSVCMADFNEEKFIEKQKTTNCTSSGTKTKTFNIYTMNYMGKVCEKNAQGKYGSCYDGSNPFGNKNYPCRLYDYHQRSCTCTYSKNTNKFCSSSVSATGDDHTMKIKYNEDANGHASCESDVGSSFNSYVHDVCWYGKYSGTNTVMTFHGYQFFKGEAIGYKEFNPNGSWFHDSLGSGGNFDIRVSRGEDVDGKPNYAQGCRDTCVRFTEVISGKVD